jgi:hypothetical protein
MIMKARLPRKRKKALKTRIINDCFGLFKPTKTKMTFYNGVEFYLKPIRFQRK